MWWGLIAVLHASGLKQQCDHRIMVETLCFIYGKHFTLDAFTR
jgi:uncharacterized protein (UPF0303 family)